MYSFGHICVSILLTHAYGFFNRTAIQCKNCVLLRTLNLKKWTDVHFLLMYAFPIPCLYPYISAWIFHRLKNKWFLFIYAPVLCNDVNYKYIIKLLCTNQTTRTSRTFEAAVRVCPICIDLHSGFYNVVIRYISFIQTFHIIWIQSSFGC